MMLKPESTRYHMAHHRNQGVEGIDTDVPTLFEGYLITTSLLAKKKPMGNPRQIREDDGVDGGDDGGD